MRRFIWLIIIFVLGISACGGQKVEEVDFYSIKLGEFKEHKSAENFINEIEQEFSDTLFINKSRAGFEVLAGKFDYPYNASEKGYSLFNNSIIKTYEVVKNDSVVANPAAEICFISGENNQAALFSFDMVKKDYRQIWAKEGEDVYDIVYSDELKDCIFLTKSKQGNIKIHQINLITTEAELLRDLKITEYETIHYGGENQFRIEFMQDGERFAKFIDLKGNLVKSIEVTEDKRKTFLSPSNNYKLVIDKVAGVNNIFISETAGKRSYLTATGQEVKTANWSGDEKFVFLLTSNNSNKSNLFIFNVEQAEISKVSTHNNIRKFLLKDDTLIFDKGSGQDSMIMFYDYEKDKSVYKLELPGGCSLSKLNN